MRIRIGNQIEEVTSVEVRKTDIVIGTQFFITGEDTNTIGKQLFESGYADLTRYKRV